MSKKTWSMILLCVLAALLIVLCVVGLEMKENLRALEHAEPTDGLIPGAGILTFIYANLSFCFGFLITAMAISCLGFLISCLNISIAPNRVIKSFSVGFLVMYSIPAVLVIVMIAGAIFF